MLNNIMVNIRYVRKINRTTDYYDVGKIFCLNITKQHHYKITWNKWLFNKRIVQFILRREINKKTMWIHKPRQLT